MPKKPILALVFLLLIPALFAQAPAPIAPQGETRVALVIGNSAYPNVPLKNPVNDARDLAAALKGLGFSVTLLADGDMSAMTLAIRDFGNAIKRPDAVALFYYSGHGIQYKGANYLVPAKSDIQDPDELAFSAVNAEQVYAKMESSGDKTNVVILDACRNNPFPGAERSMEKGLAIVGSAPPQSLIVYATAPGRTAQDGAGRNGVFTAALLKHLAEPRLDAELMIRRVRDDVIAATGGVQVPWSNSSVTGGGFSFAGGGRLLVSTDPSGAEIFVDGERRGVSPLSLADLPRYSEFEISAKSGAKSATRRLTITDSSEAKLQLSLQTAHGSISVTASEKGVKAFIDGAEVALGATGAIEGVEVGLHSLELRGDSSGFKAQVEVSARQAAKVNATLVPVGSLTLTLPEGASCKIEGMGVSDTTSRYNYGQVPAGRYLLTVSGGDYETHSESVTVERGKKYDFAPAVRYTADYLLSRFGPELDRLQKAANGGAASQADVDDALALAKKIKAEDRPELETLAAKAGSLYSNLVSLRPSSSAQQATNTGKNTGTLILESDPPGMEVSIDGGDPLTTPISIELSPGAHSFEPEQTYIGRNYYAAQSLQWIRVNAGDELKVPIRIKAATGKLEIRYAPSGYKVFANGEEIGTTPLGPIDVKAGFVVINFVKKGWKEHVQQISVIPNKTVFLNWY